MDRAVKLPHTFTAGAHRWQLRTEPHLEEFSGCLGATVPRSLLVVVDGGLEGTARAQVVLHELLHVALDGAGLESDDEERMVDAAAGPLLQILRGNPRLVEVLLA